MNTGVFLRVRMSTQIPSLYENLNHLSEHINQTGQNIITLFALTFSFKDNHTEGFNSKFKYMKTLFSHENKVFIDNTTTGKPEDDCLFTTVSFFLFPCALNVMCGRVQ